PSDRAARRMAALPAGAGGAAPAVHQQHPAAAARGAARRDARRPALLRAARGARRIARRNAARAARRVPPAAVRAAARASERAPPRGAPGAARRPQGVTSGAKDNAPMLIEKQEDVTRAVLEEMHRTPDARTKEILGAVVRHLHALVREVRPTEKEF